MYVSLETLRRAVRLAGDLAELDDPADFADVALPALARLIGCDVLTCNEIGPAPGQVRYAEFFRRIPVEHQIAVSLRVSSDQVVGIALNRARTDFTEADRALLRILRAPLLAALRRARARTSAMGALPPFPPCPAGLTDRETQILQLVAFGRTDCAIARQLGVSPRTIAKHLEHIYRKLGVANRAAAVSRFCGR